MTAKPGRQTRQATPPQQAPRPVVLSLDPPATGHHPRTTQAGPDHDTDHPRTRIRTEWNARIATPADRDTLQAPAGTVVLHIRRTVIDTHGRVVKVITTVCPADRTVLHHSYRIPSA
ncbi:MAG TPA: UTRA domain-containing protein [Kineosporiaceae bacterium]|nr:UTRA domain-containing protein [Kineosporiaceae bacterium]